MLVNRDIIPPFILFALCLIVMVTALPADQAFAFPWQASFSVSDALASTDGQQVSCEKVVVGKIVSRGNPAYFVVRDPFNPNSRIVVVSRVPQIIRSGQTVDITGTVSSLSTGQRCIVNATIYGYFDHTGRFISHQPLIIDMPWITRQVLAVPEGPVPPADPALPSASLVNDVTASPLPDPLLFKSVSSLFLASPSILTAVEMSCVPVVGSEDGFIIIGDDKSNSIVKVYTKAKAKAGDRIVRLTGTVHSEGGSLVIYSDYGPEPYFDVQGFSGQVLSASPGTPAYAATLGDGNASQSFASIMGADPPLTQDNSWVYLTGQTVTVYNNYLSNSIGTSMNVYYIQGIDGTSGIRVVDVLNRSLDKGAVVDVMAQVGEMDGERCLGIYNQPGSLELRAWTTYSPLLPHPLGMSCKAFGGSDLGYNPGITGGFGLYNIGSLVRIWGRICETGWSPAGTPYAKVTDGSALPNGGLGDPTKTGIIVFDPQCQYFPHTQENTYVAVTGVASVWQPSPGSSRYPAILFPESIQILRDAYGLEYPVTGREPVSSGTISGTVTVYDGSPRTTVSVDIFCSDRQIKNVPVSLDDTGKGSAPYSLTVTKQADVDGQIQSVSYIVSAKCSGYKTRTYTNISPDAQQDFYLVPLRKMYLESNSYSIGSCPGTNTTRITATVVDDSRAPVKNKAVRFWTDKGSFAGESTIQHTAVDETDDFGVAEVTLTGVAEESGPRAHIWATDDITTPTPNNANFTASDDFYFYDWERIPGDYIGISDYVVNVAATRNKPRIARCSETSTVSAYVTTCEGAPAPDQSDVRFTLPDNGPTVFEDGNTYFDTKTTGGYAFATVKAKDLKSYGAVYVVARATVRTKMGEAWCGLEIVDFLPKVDILTDPEIISGPTNVTVTVKAFDVRPEPSVPVNLPVTLKTNMGVFINPDNGTELGKETTVSTGSSGIVYATLKLDTATSAKITATFDDQCTGQRKVHKWVKFIPTRWQNVGVNYSSPLVADLIPGDGIQEVAVVSKNDGKIHIWNTSQAEEKWISSDIIDPYGDNTLSAANIDGDNNETLEITAPCSISYGVDQNRMYVYGYDGTFKPLAGWPTLTYYQYVKVAAAIGDANLDGTMKVVAGDESCVVTSWNGVGQGLWTQVTDSLGVAITGSSVAIGQINTLTNPNRPPESVVGAMTNPGLWGFEGNEWQNYRYMATPYNYTSRWTEPTGIGMGKMASSPAIGQIDNDNINDIAVGDNVGNMWVWLSSNSTWHKYQVNSPIHSSPAVVDFDGTHAIVFGADNGRVYKVFWNETTGALEDTPGWIGGILLSEGYSIEASPVIGDVLNKSLTNSPNLQIIVANTDGNVYVLWKNGTDASGGPIAKIWSCSLGENEKIYSTPTICSLDGNNLSMIVGSTNNIYNIDLYPTTLFGNDGSRWPWPTFHHDPARTGCSTNPSSTMISASIVGRVKDSNNAWIVGAKVEVQYSTNGTTWFDDKSVNGRTEPRDPIFTVGDTSREEINRGGYVINQLQPGRIYRLKITVGSTTRTFDVNGHVQLSAQKYIQPDIIWQ